MTLKCVKDSFSRKGLLFAKRTYFCEKDFFMAKNYLLGLCLIFNVIKLKLNDINLSRYALEIDFETIFHRKGRNSHLRKGVSLLRKGLCIWSIFFLFIYLIYLI